LKKIKYDCPYFIRSADGFGKCRLISGDTIHKVFDCCTDNRYGCLLREEKLKQRLEDSKETISQLRDALQSLYDEIDDTQILVGDDRLADAMDDAEEALKAVEK